MYRSADRYIPQSVDTRLPLITWAVFAVGALLVLSLVVAAPLAQANDHPLVAITLYSAFSKVCHQLPERSFFISGHPFAVCARCTGLYVGFTAALLVYPLVVSLRQTCAPPRKWLLLAATPLAIDFSLGYLGVWENTHLSRLSTGALLGAVAVFFVMPGLSELSIRGLRSMMRQNKKTEALAAVSHVAAAPSDYSEPARRI